MDEPYEIRKKSLQLSTQEKRRVRGDLIQVFKIVHGFENVDANNFFFKFEDNSPHETRGHEFKKNSPQLLHVGRQHFFDYRIIEEWNSLPADIVKKIIQYRLVNDDNKSNP